MKPDGNQPNATSLRSQAEAALQAQAASLPGGPEVLSPDAARRMLHELQVHQIELEMQNEELRRTQRELDAARERYFDLYNRAPVGYLTISKEGLIRETNLTAAAMLGATRSVLEMRPFSQFIFQADQDHHYLNFKTLFETGAPLVWELRLVRMDKSRLWARLEATVEPHAEGGPECRLVLSDVTEKKLAEEALEKTRHMLAETERLGKVGGWEFDIGNNRLTWTEEIYRIHELDLTFEPTVHDAVDFYTPASRPTIVRAVQRAIDFGEPFDVELELITAKGNLKPVHSIGRADLAQGRIYGFFQDITTQKQAERSLLEWNQSLEDRVAERTRELQLSESRFRQLTETTFEGIAISQDGRLIDANSRLAEMHGYELAEMVGRPVTDFVAPESHAKVTEHIRNGLEVSYEFLGLRRDGSTMLVEAHGRTGSWHGTASRITALRDLTESKRLAAKLQTQQAALEHAQRLALISEVCAGIIHQISQPLCAMGLNLAVIQASLTAAAETSGETLEILTDIIASVASLREVIHHLRALLQTDRPEHLSTDSHHLLEEALPLLRQEAEHRGIQLTTELGPKLPPVLADPVQLNQVILILTRNAFDACTACPPDRRRVVIAIRAMGDTAVEWSVRDTGSGIAPGVIDHLFSPFFTTKTSMGIGLRLSRTIVEAHGGRIEASNNADGIGATFRITLPICSPADPA